MITYRQMFSIIRNTMTDEQMDQPIQIMDADGDITTIDNVESVEVADGHGTVRNFYYMMMWRSDKWHKGSYESNDTVCHLYWWHTKRAQTPLGCYDERSSGMRNDYCSTDGAPVLYSIHSTCEWSSEQQDETSFTNQVLQKVFLGETSFQSPTKERCTFSSLILHSLHQITMTQTEIINAISNAFNSLSDLNEMIYDYWISELYTEDGDMIDEMWNEDTLNQMETDVMYNSWSSLISPPNKQMQFTKAQLDKIVEIYATALVDSMDQKMLENFVYETIVENMSNLSEEDLLNGLYAYYDEEDADKIVESVSSL
jgi:hypothetical protein